jgi:malate dehydrogenase
MKDITIGVPCIIGRNGIEKIIEVKLAPEELEKLKASEAAVRKTTATLKDLNVL